jgi:ankyrin repeat protein
MNLVGLCSRGNLDDVARAVGEEGANVNEPDGSGRTALLEAAWNGNAGIVDYLLSQGADPNAADRSGFTPIMRAVEGGHRDIVGALINKGADVNCRGRVRGVTPLMLAAENGHLELIAALLDSGAEINAADSYEETALARAGHAGQEQAAQLLESRGGRVKQERSSYSNTDRDAGHVTVASVPHWSAASQDAMAGGYGGGQGFDD